MTYLRHKCTKCVTPEQKIRLNISIYKWLFNKCVIIYAMVNVMDNM